ncbi:hypothetical protein CKO25_13620 [Thiocapsa imhoffii]|uniref:Uncharacterized protein n=1 Tax=Thiocapsa imhoffii TaxID=382777 RepID=A0A9X0WK77_9GAMM|nr:hypothetical protein [Thiocapsa imhoffii]MBK1645667.1 hypothetical protein [Thiocapsa imhoffii]
MSDPITGYCWKCGGGLTAFDYGRETRCGGCDQPTHSCRNCRHYAPGRANACVEPMVDLVLEKERANFCDWFQPQPKRQAAGDGVTATNESGDPAETLRRAAEDLFR